MVAEGDQVAVHWAAKGTFAGPNSFQGIEPTFSRLDLAGLDIFDLRDGLIVREHAYTDGSEFARQIGMLPPAGSTAEQRVTRAFNGQAKLKRRALCADPERIAEGVWLVRGGFPLKTMNVYLLEDASGGVTMFEAGIKAMASGLQAAASSLGGLNRIVLGHAHADHRGAAPALKVPTFIHPDDRVDAEGDGGMHYMDISKVPPPARWTIPRLLPVWDGGPVEIAGTVEEGDDVSGFRVVHIPGHSPGQIALWRESDRLALTADCFYTLDPGTGRHGAPRVPLAGLQLRHRAGARLDPQDRRARAGGRLAGPRRRGDRRRPRAARAGGRGDRRPMGRRSRRRGAEQPAAPETPYEDAEGNVLVLRGAMTPATRSQYAQVRAGGLNQEDAWQRSVEFLFERLAVSWTIAGAEPIERQKELLARYRFASGAERTWIRGVLREHLAEWFPDVEAP